MAQKAYPWTANAVGDGTTGGYTALEWSDLWRDLFLGGQEAAQGVLKGVGGELAVSGTASPLSVAIGSAIVYGKHYRNTSAVSLSVTTPVVAATGGVVVLRLDWAAQTVRLLVNRNTDGLVAIPTLTQSTSTVWEIALATFVIATNGSIALTDARQFCHFSTRVATANLDDSAVTGAKIAATVAGDGLSGGAGQPLAVNVDNQTLEIGGDFVQVRPLGIDIYHLANASVDEYKITGGIPSLIRRQGGSSSNWKVAGTSNYTPSGVRMQSGATTVVHSAGSSMTGNVTFPVAYTQPPIVMATVASLNGGEPVSAIVTSVTTTGFSIYAYSIINGYTLTQDQSFNWVAIGTI